LIVFFIDTFSASDWISVTEKTFEVDDLTTTKKKSKAQATTKSRQEGETNKTNDLISSLPAEVELDLSEDVTSQDSV
jgi:hypothetical protein